MSLGTGSSADQCRFRTRVSIYGSRMVNVAVAVTQCDGATHLSVFNSL